MSDRIAADRSLASWLGWLALVPVVVVHGWARAEPLPSPGLSQPPQYLPIKARWCLAARMPEPSPLMPAAVVSTAQRRGQIGRAHV